MLSDIYIIATGLSCRDAKRCTTKKWAWHSLIVRLLMGTQDAELITTHTRGVVYLFPVDWKCPNKWLVKRIAGEVADCARSSLVTRLCSLSPQSGIGRILRRLSKASILCRFAAGKWNEALQQTHTKVPPFINHRAQKSEEISQSEIRLITVY